ncbi:hypothetical protein BS50DRAFT_652997 [Corynespora cassiicola Philippines]|uniref:DUF7730 domain-containing protein n=1 Tax=Corynespora cassiicola Philippines TaxID=1448308 RepID=A0A2T2P5S5_CORCC|nr:hypothetical protein BS50DRAFT_652997 [Corynespora cassiicola Philippines]
MSDILPKAPVSLLDLPTEIRITIFENLLVDYAHTIQSENKFLGRRRSLTLECPEKPQVRPDDRLSAEALCRLRNRRSGSNLSIPLLSVCTVISVEASNVFYGKNIFSFQSLDELNGFLIHNFRQIHLVRKVLVYEWHIDTKRLAYTNPSVAKSTFCLLSSAASLEAFYIGHGFLSQSDKPSSLESCAGIFYRSSYPWLQMIGVRNGDRFSALSILQFPRPPRRFNPRPNPHTQQVPPPKWWETNEGIQKFKDSLKDIIKSE